MVHSAEPAMLYYILPAKIQAIVILLVIVRLTLFLGVFNSCLLRICAEKL